MDVCETGDESRAVKRFELIEARAVDYARDQLARIIGLSRIRFDDAVDFFRIIRRRVGLDADKLALLDPVETRDDTACEAHRVVVVFRQMICDT